VNRSPVAPATRRRYAEQNAAPVESDIPELESMGVEVLAADLLQKGPKVRHNPEAVARVAVDLALRGREKRMAGLRH
jgi:hypothetical protein